MPRSYYKETTLDPGRPLAEASDAGRLLAIYGIGRQLLEQREPQQVIATIQQAIVEHLKPDHACVLALDSGGACRPVACHRLNLDSPFQSWPLSHTALRRTRESGLAVLAFDAEIDERLAGAESVQKLGIRSVICVPLGRPVRGLLYLDNRSKRAFTKDDLDFVSAVSLYASLVLERAEEHARTADALRRSSEQLALLQEELLRHEIIGRAPSLLAAYDTLRRLARAGARVLLRGETGTGKELFARAYAASSPRAGKAYVPVPIPALAASLIESELFGHVRGAFTEANRDKKGRLELADGGTLFLDEVGDIEPALQAKLFRFLDSGELVRVGDTERRQIDALVVSATNRPLERDMEAGQYRPDLFARLGHAIAIPPLRERVEDIPLLVEHYARVHSRGGSERVFAKDAIAALQRHSWPFNVRELQQVVERTLCLADSEVLREADLPRYIREGEPPLAPAGPSNAPAELQAAGVRPMREVVEQAERDAIVRALEFARGNKRRAIELLGVSSETFYRRLEAFGLRQKQP